ncbi:MAG: class D sortase [Clostridia bacterium]|nr:class D sortase [Clostridia bacterium]
MKETKEKIWQIEIPKIDLVAPISEGTSQEVMLEFVGHFENTSKWKGNVGLAAHNRGYPINYFSKLKELEVGDKIVYKTELGTKAYSVKIIKIIKDTDWSYLQSTKENRITLITCVENKPSQRLCIQGIEIKEE